MVWGNGGCCGDGDWLIWSFHLPGLSSNDSPVSWLRNQIFGMCLKPPLNVLLASAYAMCGFVFCVVWFGVFPVSLQVLS